MTLLGACSTQPIHLTVIQASSVRAISLMGDTIWTLPVDPRDGPRLMARLNEARAMVSEDPEDLTAMLNLGRRTAAIGQFPQAIEVLTRAARVHYLSPRVFRERGEVLLSVRELGPAYEDFEKAQTLIDAQRTGLADPGRVRPKPEDTTSVQWGVIVETADETDSTGGPLLTSVQFQVALHMGVIRYLRGDFPAARDFLIEAARRASTDDDLALAALWLFFATRRAGNLTEAAEILTAVKPDWAVQAHQHEHQLLLAFGGQIPGDTVQRRALNRLGGGERSLYCYGIGFMLLVSGRTDEAELWLEQARTIPDWTRLSYLAAEADLARLLGRKPGGDD
jgi:tetratricopeptide (TPR) repeat protein